MTSSPVSGRTQAIASKGHERESSAAIELADVNAVVRSLAGRPLSEEVQEQLGRLQSIIDAYEPGALGKDYLESLYVAAMALAADQPNVLLAQGILWDLEFYLIYSGTGAAYFLAKITGGWPMVTASIGMICAICLFVIFWLSFITLDHFKALPRFLWSGGPEFPTAILFGVIGGAISILTRIKRPVDLQKLNPISLFLNCLFKPMVGGIFAGIVDCMLDTNLFGGALKAGFVGDKEYLYILLVAVIGFIAGFSERFAADAISAAEAIAGR